MNDKQIKTFDSLRNGHFQKINHYREEMRGLKDSFFSQLRSPMSPRTDTLARRIGSLQTKMDLETFDHFSQLRSLLNEEQSKKFDNIIQDLLRTMDRRVGSPPPEGGRRRPPDGPPN